MGAGAAAARGAAAPDCEATPEVERVGVPAPVLVAVVVLGADCTADPAPCWVLR